jgi:FtsP/CotA-like multicopper oxidase with cupredoxin domain
LPNKITPTLGINQDFLGVTLFANQGDKVHISVKNTIDQTTTHSKSIAKNLSARPYHLLWQCSQD